MQEGKGCIDDVRDDTPGNSRLEAHQHGRIRGFDADNVDGRDEIFGYEGCIDLSSIILAKQAIIRTSLAFGMASVIVSDMFLWIIRPAGFLLACLVLGLVGGRNLMDLIPLLLDLFRVPDFFDHW